MSDQQSDITISQAEAIKSARHARGMTQEHLAKAAGVSERTVKRAENGGTLSDETLLALAAVLGMDISSIRKPSARVAEDLVAAASRPSDTPRRRANIERLAQHSLAHVPGLKAFIAPDVNGYVKAHGPFGERWKRERKAHRTWALAMTANLLFCYLLFGLVSVSAPAGMERPVWHGVVAAWIIAGAAWCYYGVAFAWHWFESRSAGRMEAIRAWRESLAYAVSETHLHVLSVEGGHIRHLRHSLDRLTRWGKEDFAGYFDYELRFGLRREYIRSVHSIPEFDAVLARIPVDHDVVYSQPGVIRGTAVA